MAGNKLFLVKTAAFQPDSYVSFFTSMPVFVLSLFVLSLCLPEYTGLHAGTS